MSSAPTTTEKLRAVPWLVAHMGGVSAFALLTFFGPLFPLYLLDRGNASQAVGK
jgi:hypothetical protein